MVRNRVAKPVLVLFLLLLIVASAGPLQAASGAGRTPGLDVDRYNLPIHDYTLANGLRVFLVKDASAPVVAVNVTYHVGAADDPEGRSGFAHLFEHMMFHGSENVPRGAFDAYMTAVGADYNAFTAKDETVYYATVPVQHLPLVLWLESDRMGSLVVDQEGFETERQVVIEEYNEYIANSPYGYAGDRVYVLPFLGYVPYARPVIGSVADLRAAILVEVQAFHARYYLPNNATLAIVGDIDIPQTKALVEAYFGAIPAGEPVVPILDRYPSPLTYPVLRTDETTGCAIGYEEVIVDPLAELPRVYTTVAGPGPLDPDYYALHLLSLILADGNSSRLNQNIVEEGLALYAGVDFDTWTTGASTWVADLIPNLDEQVEIGFNLLRAEYDRLIEEGVTGQELARVKNRLELELIADFRATVGNTAEAIQNRTRRVGDPNFLEQEIERYRAVTVEDLQRVAQTYLCEQPMSLVTVLQEGEPVVAADPGLLVAPVEVNPDPLASLPEEVVRRTEAPASLPAVDQALPPFQQVALDNGLRVLVVEQHKSPQVELSLYVGGGRAALPEDKQGVTDLLAVVIVKGTMNRTADEINAAVESIGGSLGAAADVEAVSVEAAGPSSEQDVLFDILADVVRNPAFPADDFAVAQEQALAGMEFDRSDPDTLARRQFRRIAYPGHPYSYYATPDVMAALEPADLAAFHGSYFKPNNAVLVIAGDITVEEAQAQAARVFSDWEAGDVPDYLNYPQLDPSAILADHAGAIYLVDLPSAEQATIRIGNLAIPSTHPSRYALSLGNYVLGGPVINSRLNLNLREKHGYTYGVRSVVESRNDVGLFAVAGSVGQDVVGDAVHQVLYELARIQSRPLTEQELADAKSFLVGEFLMESASAGSYAERLVNTVMSGLPVEEIYRIVPGYQNTTAKEVLAAVRASIEADQPLIVVVADAAVAKPQLEELGPVIVVDVDGNPAE